MTNGDAAASTSTTAPPAETNGTPTTEAAPPTSKPSKPSKPKPSASGALNNKKRKADVALDDNASVASSNPADTKPPKPPTKKLKKKDTEAKTKDKDAAPKTGGGGKPKGPVDVEKQCGVQLANGSMCARSLTCKSHSMGAKRAVPGRSLPYDILLAQYQKKNQAKQQKERMAAHGAAVDAEDGVGGNGGPVDSDEERDR
ncbi:MAG: hypothetical protein Q9162_003220, partial [Coniocarpon cinnabarinum]